MPQIKPKHNSLRTLLTTKLKERPRNRKLKKKPLPKHNSKKRKLPKLVATRKLRPLIPRLSLRNKKRKKMKRKQRRKRRKRRRKRKIKRKKRHQPKKRKRRRKRRKLRPRLKRKLRRRKKKRRPKRRRRLRLRRRKRPKHLEIFHRSWTQLPCKINQVYIKNLAPHIKLLQQSHQSQRLPKPHLP